MTHDIEDGIAAVFDRLLSRDADPSESLIYLVVESGGYTKSEAIAILKAGRNKLLDWMDENSELLHYMAASKSGGMS